MSGLAAAAAGRQSGAMTTRAFPAAGAGRRFLFLQGPHGPFFHALAGALRATGGDCARVAFNGGDRVFWPDRASRIDMEAPLARWPDVLEALVAGRGITDLVLYGDRRPVHRAALEIAAARGLVAHVFEEGYLRPSWATYERGGANGASRLFDVPLAAMERALSAPGSPRRVPPDRWGDMKSHMAWGAAYHAAVLADPGPLPPHRGVSVGTEFRLHLGQFVRLPRRIALRRAGMRRLRRSGAPFHVVLLQLEHDANFRHWSPFPGTEAFLDAVFAGFAAGAPAHHRLILKAHPLEDGRIPFGRIADRLAEAHGLSSRVDLMPGGRLAALLDEAESAVTVTSTAAQQALWRGLPVKAFGRAVYAREGLVSDQPIADFFAAPRPPDPDAFSVFRQFLLETSQIPGGYYSARGRRLLLRRLPDMMLDTLDPYARRLAAAEAGGQQSAALAGRIGPRAGI